MGSALGTRQILLTGIRNAINFSNETYPRPMVIVDSTSFFAVPMLAREELLGERGEQTPTPP